MKGSPIKLGTIQGTAGHRSALKMKMEKDAAAKLRKESAMKMKKESPFKNEYVKAKEKDPKLDSYIIERDKHEPGSAEYEAQQSKINAAYGKKRDPKLKEAQIKNLNKKKTESKQDTEVPKPDSDKQKKLKSNNLREILFDVNKDGNVITRLFKKKNKKSDDGGGKTMIQKKKEKDAENKKIFGKSPGKMKKKGAMKMKKESAMKMKKESMAKMKKAPSKFNAKLKAASAAGKLSGKFKEAVDAAPVKIGKTKGMKKATGKQKEFAEIARKNEGKSKKLTPKERKALLEKVKKK